MKRTTERAGRDGGGGAGELSHYGCHLGYDCNRDCLFCSTELLDRTAAKRPHRYGELCRSLRAAGAAGFRSLAFSGGEPTLSPDLPKLVEAARTAGYEEIILLSNGIKLASGSYAGRLAACGLSSVNLNIPSHEARAFDCLTGQPGGFSLLLKAIGNLSGLGIKMSAVCVLNRLNYTKLADYAAFYSALGIRVFTLNQLKFQGKLNPSVGSNDAAISRLKVRMSDCARYIKAMGAYCLRNGLYPPFLEHFVPCALKGCETRVAYAWGGHGGTRRGFLSIYPEWRSAAAMDVAGRDKIKFPGCARCLYSRVCPGVEKNYARVFGNGEFAPVTKPPEPFCAKLEGRDPALAEASFAQAMRARRPEPARAAGRPAAGIHIGRIKRANA